MGLTSLKGDLPVLESPFLDMSPTSLKGDFPVQKSLSFDTSPTSLKGDFSVQERHLSDTSTSTRTGDLPVESTGVGKDDLLDRAYRKVDKRLLCWYIFVFMIIKLESHNVVNAAVMNLEAGTDIKHQLGDLTDVQWASILGAFHFPFIIVEPLSTLMLKRFTPRLWMGRIMITWGIIATCTGATQNFAGLFSCRFLLGIAEAGFLPSIIYHLTFWYPADRLPVRVAISVALPTLSGSLSGILSFAISFLNGKCGLAGWRWLFIIEGIPAVLCGIITLIWLPNYPEDTSILTEPERAAILANRPKAQPNSKDQTWNAAQVKALLKDWTLYSFAFLWLCHVLGAFGIGSVLPTVIHELGIANSGISQLMTIPVPILGGIILLVIAWLIQRKKLKPWLTAGILNICVLACYIALILVKGALVRYILIMLAMIFGIGVLPILWPERIRATNGTTGAGLAIGITTAVASTNGVISPHIYLERFAPTYRTSYIISIGMLVASTVLIAVTKVLVDRKHKRESPEEDQTEMAQMVSR